MVGRINTRTSPTPPSYITNTSLLSSTLPPTTPKHHLCPPPSLLRHQNITYVLHPPSYITKTSLISSILPTYITKSSFMSFTLLPTSPPHHQSPTSYIPSTSPIYSPFPYITNTSPVSSTIPPSSPTSPMSSLLPPTSPVHHMCPPSSLHHRQHITYVNHSTLEATDIVLLGEQ
ncbi:uncharacterized protein [Haliotis asinina]|uniref:uncharacterized protein n=1 Tax=Haliotis asinina TaxID=109174 RepID=UPI0035320333